MIELEDVEDEIIKLAIIGLLNHGYFMSVFDGEETTVEPCRDIDLITQALKTTDEDFLHCFNNLEGHCCVGWVRLVYGNSEWEVICDYTTNLDDQLNAAKELADMACEYYG
ncbi:SRCR domain protein [Vibrio phage 2.096.O._10N.286.48.B5]|nr:SRCR domain protein [Vibrio phage 2.096.O._10N.286.48.B5]